jgi:predicted nucleotidyltransferase
VSELEVRRHVISDLEGAVTADFPHCRVELFGSFCAGLSTFLSDLDVSVTSTVNGSSAHIADRWDARADLAEQEEEEEEEAEWDNSTVDSAVEGGEDGIKGTGTAASSSETSSTVAEVVAWSVHRDPDAEQTEAAAGEVCAAEGGDTWDKSSVQHSLPVVGLHTVYEVLQVRRGGLWL